MSRTIVVGDIHGCYDELIKLLEKVELTSADRVVSVGDLIAKGPKSKEVLDLFSNDTRFSSVIGNHDLKVLSFWKGEDVFLKDSHKQVCLELESEKGRNAANASGRVPATCKDNDERGSIEVWG
jgi:predicted phosphodiesterase